MIIRGEGLDVPKSPFAELRSMSWESNSSKEWLLAGEDFVVCNESVHLLKRAHTQPLPIGNKWWSTSSPARTLRVLYKKIRHRCHVKSREEVEEFPGNMNVDDFGDLLQEIYAGLFSRVIRYTTTW